MPVQPHSILSLTVTRAETGQTLQTFLAERLKLSKRQAKDLIDARQVFVNRQCIWMARHALQGGDTVDGYIAALEGFTFEGPKGTITIRAEDHAVIQPMFQVKLVADGDGFVPELIDTVDAETVAPPVAG